MKFYVVKGLALLATAMLFSCQKNMVHESNKTIDAYAGLERPTISSFSVNSIAYADNKVNRTGNDLLQLKSSTGNGGLPRPPVGSAYPDGRGKIDSVFNSDDSNFELYFRQKYLSQMFTISDQSMANQIYPGAILDGRSITGEFDPKMLEGISSGMRPVTISTSLPASSGTIARTSLPRPIAGISLYNAALTDLENLNPGGSFGAAALHVELDSFTVYEELKTMYGFNKKVDVFFVESGAEKLGENHLIKGKSALKLKFFQENFTIDLDVPTNESSFFDPTGLDMQQITGGTIPVYVNSVTYGRMGIMVIESSVNADKLYRAVYKQQAILRNLIGIDRNMTDEDKSIIEQADIKVKYTGVGTDADGTIKVNGLQGFIDILTANATYNKDSPGIPVAFQLAYLDNRTLVSAPFQINFGPYDKPAARIEYDNIRQTNFQNQVRGAVAQRNADVYLSVYRNASGADFVSAVPPDFLVFRINQTHRVRFTDVMNTIRNFNSETITKRDSVVNRRLSRVLLCKNCIISELGELEGVFHDPSTGQQVYKREITDQVYSHLLLSSPNYYMLSPRQ